MAELETVDLEGVEILAVGGPVFGQGSPPGGDFWTSAELRAMAEADQELGDEIKPPAKIGHSDAQGLVLNSDLAPVTAGEMPAVGWLENLRLNDDGSKLLADIKDVPRKLAELINAKAYRTRSVELSRVTSQATGKTFEWVVTGLAWLGAKMPAVRTLDDVVALYEDAELEVPQGTRAFVVYAVGDIVWTAGDSYEAIRNDLSEALNGPETGGMVEPRWWVRDVSPDGKALVVDWHSVDELDAWIVPFTRADDGTITPAPVSAWVKAEAAWVETAKDYSNALSMVRAIAAASAKFPGGRDLVREIRAAAESRPMPDVTLTEEQVAQLKEKLGDSFDGTAEKLLEAFTAQTDRVAELEAKADEADQRKLEADEATTKLRDLEQRVEKSERRLFEKERDEAVDGAIKTGKLDPADREKWQKRYEGNPELTKEILDELKPDEKLLRELGSDDNGLDDADDADRKYEDDAAALLGIPKEQVL